MNPEAAAEMLDMETADEVPAVPETIDLGMGDAVHSMPTLGKDADFITAGPAGEPGTPGAAVKAPPKSDTAFKLDDWSKRRGFELVEECDELRKLAKLAEKLADDAVDAGRASAKAKFVAPVEKTDDEKYWASVAADFHTAAYDPTPEVAEGCTDKLRSDFVGALLETQEFHQIRASTELDPIASEVATIAFASQFAKRLEEEKARKAAGPKPGKGKRSAAAADPDGSIATMRAAASACATAMKDVKDAKDAADMCGFGSNSMGGGGGDSGQRLDKKRLAALHKRVRNSAQLRRIAELAGRYRRLAQGKQRMKVSHGVDEVMGVTQGDDIAKLLPVELTTLIDEDYGWETARRLIEQQTMQYRTRANEPAGKGPIVVTVDESGSMSGNKIETAKALALALAWIARRQRRWCVLVGFSGGTEGNRIILKPGQANEVALMDWLEHFYGNGTDMDVPLYEVPKWWPEFIANGMSRGKTDIIMITDAACNVSPEFRDFFNNFKKEEHVKLTAMVVQGHPGNLTCVTDEVFQLPAITTESEAVGKVLSI